MTTFLILLALSVKSVLAYVAIRIAFGGFPTDTLHSIGYPRIALVALAFLLLALVLNFWFSDFRVWTIEFWISNAYADDVVAFLTFFSAFLHIQILRSTLLRR
jgi:hypothetical protein